MPRHVMPPARSGMNFGTGVLGDGPPTDICTDNMRFFVLSNFVFTEIACGLSHFLVILGSIGILL